MSNRPRLESVAGDALISTDTAAFQSPTRSYYSSTSTSPTPRNTPPTTMQGESSVPIAGQSSLAGERRPLLGNGAPKKPFYRARPLWLVPFAITAALVRGMTLAPRVEVFTQLACQQVQHHDNPWNHTQLISLFDVPTSDHAFYSSLDPLGPHLSVQPVNATPANDDDDDDDVPDAEKDPRRIPSARCSRDATVQAGAARLQTIMTTTMGFLSALTTGWWGHFGERYGRTRVLALATFGLFLTDLMFIIVSTPNSPLSGHGHKFLLVAPIIEGLLGGWSTLQSATSAYVSDCTSSGSRATIFSRFTGVFYLGFSVGPSIGGWVVRSGIGAPAGQPKTVTFVFYLSAFFSLVNFLLVLLVFPESLSKEKRQRAKEEYHGHGKGKGRASSDEGECDAAESSSSSSTSKPGGEQGIIRGFLSPLAIFLPVSVSDSTGLKKRTDWSLTLLAAALFGHFLSTGVYQIKYLYAVHVYGWGVEQLGYYISFLGGARAVYLLFLLPLIIGTFKPKPAASKNAANKGKATSGVKAKPTKAHLAREITFDLFLTRFSLVVDILANVFVVLFPAPTYKVHALSTAHSTQESQTLFVFASSLASFGSGVVPAVQSLALCIVQARALANGDQVGGENGVVTKGGDAGTGKLFGALAVLQAVGQMILGPMLFGLVYSGTVAQYPKAIFAVAGGILMLSIVCIFLVRSPVERSVLVNTGKGKRRRTRDDSEVSRGRSRKSKDLFGGTTR